ncbi:PQQ-dependent sugar dehydrogenase [Alteromonas sp. ASW11-130]|uniref:PQQ-dependent sugar dehydrogenase n=1 Tax=Alteromonas sp. ASW11-130 TaxID=3015775 RepID=UPI002241AC4B|nr:PQQ-dependent sugar dehydrogenase [Alteromonas sp. ASW11-130]MCW8090488.1 PQQ-dependent sugar dehydrogenase [Alteromonas sp. ASW11-130]
MTFKEAITGVARISLLICSLASGFSAAAASPIQITPLADKLHRPWTMAELPNGDWLITLRGGQLIRAKADGTKDKIELNLPDLYVESQGGLLDFALAQDFALSGTVLLSFSQGNEEANRLVVASGKFENNVLSDLKVILKVTPDKDTPVHHGGRLLTLPDGTWLVTSGEGFDYREQAQVKESLLGKILHFREDGSHPQEPPFPTSPFVYTLGHRNPQGLIYDEQTKQVIAHEHGPDGGDEINILSKGKNYGWPVITLGEDYSGASISPFQAYPGMEQPVVNWTPSIAPSGMALYRGNQFPDLEGKLLVTALKEKALYAVDLGAAPPTSKRIFPQLNQRLRDVTVSQDGSIVILTDGANAKLLKISSNNIKND